ncbi:unnamed protein product, partial [Rotaria sp. Silwood1]
MKTFYGATTA